jgi:exonuclease VII small subunit
MASVGQVKTQILMTVDCLDRAAQVHRDFESDMDVLRLTLRERIAQVRELLQRAWKSRAALQDARTALVPLYATDSPKAAQAHRQIESALDEAEKSVIALMQAEETLNKAVAQLANADSNSIILLDARISQARNTLRDWNARL